MNGKRPDGIRKKRVFDRIDRIDRIRMFMKSEPKR